LIQSIDELATIRGVETLFLHVDTTNFGALSLYQQSGYSLVPPTEPMYQEFTRSLNLHDGATKGRNHYLLMKDLLPPTWLPESYMQQRESRTGTLGFDITA
jgi:ribosomal protein S18 acetylase RimI-like enzyme